MAANQPLESEVPEELLFELLEFFVAHIFHDGYVVSDGRIAKHQFLEVHAHFLIRLGFEAVLKCSYFVFKDVVEKGLLFMQFHRLNLAEELLEEFFHLVIIGYVVEFDGVSIKVHS